MGLLTKLLIAMAWYIGYICGYGRAERQALEEDSTIWRKRKGN